MTVRVVPLKPVDANRSTMAFTMKLMLEKKATEKLYLLLPNHECPQKDCPFHPPAEESKEEEDLATETLTKLQQIGAHVEEGGGLMMPPGPPPKQTEVEEDALSRDYYSEVTVDTGEESVASDYESVMTVDSGVGRERDEFSDTGEAFLIPVSPDLHLHCVDEDDEVRTLTSEAVIMEEENDADDERVTPVLFAHSQLVTGFSSVQGCFYVLLSVGLSCRLSCC